MADARPWVIDTSTFTHLSRAGHVQIVRELAPDGVVLVPSDVNDEIERGRLEYPGIPAIGTLDWVQLVVPTEDEVWTQLDIKAQMGGRPIDHLGECAVIACARHRGMTAILDDRAAIAQADRLSVASHDTLWIVVEAYKALFARDRRKAAEVVDDLLRTGMWLPIESGESLIGWAYTECLLP
jgi:predicted nucleic acid-binding protein